jgi:hypothetical protein
MNRTGIKRILVTLGPGAVRVQLGVGTATGSDNSSVCFPNG